MKESNGNRDYKLSIGTPVFLKGIGLARVLPSSMGQIAFDLGNGAQRIINASQIQNHVLSVGRLPTDSSLLDYERIYFACPFCFAKFFSATNTDECAHCHSTGLWKTFEVPPWLVPGVDELEID